ncbi:MAG TPA: serine protease [Ktedonobacterales bacterium]|nr:serine protease [Ktedonobacterales bacterium]
MSRFFPRHRKAGFGPAFQMLLLVALLMLAALPTAIVGTPAARAQALDASASKAVTLDSPAVVRIIGALQGGLICHACDSSGADIVSPQSGAFQWATTGSGAFISPDGYILTADHVADQTANNPLNTDFVVQSASQDIGQRYNLDPNAVLNFLQNHSSQVQIIVQSISQTVFLSTGYTGQLEATGAAISYPVTRIVTSSPVDQQDTAIIQVGAQDMPNLTMAQASDVSTGETITAIAFPGDADQVTQNGGAGTGDWLPLYNPSQSDAGTISSLLTPTVETGQITAQKTATGTLYYETSAISNHGSSGGSVVDDQGRVIGFVDQGSETGRVSVLVSSSVAESYIRQAGVNNSGQGAFETLWTKAVNEYYASSPCHFTNAASDLNKLHTNYPAFGGIQPLLRNAQAQATPSDCPASSISLLLVGGIGGGLALVIIVTLVAVLLLRRRSAQPALAPAGTGYNSGAGTMPGMLPQTGFSAPVIGQPSSPPGYQPVAAAPWYNGNPDGTVQPGMPAQASALQAGQAYPSGPHAYQQPGIGHPSGPSAYQQAQASAVAVCANGHAVQEPSAQFCPTCGAPVQHAAFHQ